MAAPVNLMEEMNYTVHRSPQQAALAFPARFHIESYSKTETAVPFLDENTEALGPLPPAHRVAFLCIAPNNDSSALVLRLR